MCSSSLIQEIRHCCCLLDYKIDLYLRINCSYSDRDKVILERRHSDGMEENQEDAKWKNMNLPFWSETEEETLASGKWDLLRKK